jgi:hypothetical protein
MKKDTLIFMITLIFVFIIFIFQRPIRKAMTRGYKNNNPGNIRITRDSKGNQTFWKNEIKGTDTAFKTFKTMADGYRALFALLLEYEGKGYNTVHKIINRYAPSNENATDTYINFVCQKTGLEPDQKINFDDEAMFMKFVSAISWQENGISPDQKDVQKGFDKLSL